MFSRWSYIKNVLGVSQWIRPEVLPIEVQGSLQCDWLILICENTTEEKKHLICRIMQALKIQSYTVVRLKSAKNFSTALDFLERSSAQRFLAFGLPWNDFLSQRNFCKENSASADHSGFHFFSSPLGIRGLALDPLTAFIGDNPPIREKKKAAFQAFQQLLP